MRIVIARSAAEMQPFKSAWECLEASSGATIFQSFAWNELAARVFSDRERPFVVYAETGNGAAVIPTALIRDGTLNFLGEKLFDYCEVLTQGDGDALALAWTAIAELRRPLSVLALRADHPLDHWSPLPLEPFCRAPAALLRDTTAEAFPSAHTRLGRYWRRLLHQGVEMRRYAGNEPELVRRIYSLKAAQTTPMENLFQDAARIDFMVAAAAFMPGHCDIFTLERGSDLVAALVTFRDRHLRRFYTTCFDPAWGHYSPGTVLLFEATRISFAEGLDCDYMTGEQLHKMRLATSTVPLYRVVASADQVANLAAVRQAPQIAA